MRLFVTSFLLLACAPWIAMAATPAAPHSAASIVRWRPAAWSPPAAARTALRFEPESGEVAGVERVAASDAAIATTSQAEARRLAAQNVTVRSDGSRHAYVGAAFRSWSIATIDDAGHVTQDCVSSQAEAQARVDAAAKKQVRK